MAQQPRYVNMRAGQPPMKPKAVPKSSATPKKASRAKGAAKPEIKRSGNSLLNTLSLNWEPDFDEVLHRSDLYVEQP